MSPPFVSLHFSSVGSFGHSILPYGSEAFGRRGWRRLTTEDRRHPSRSLRVSRHPPFLSHFVSYATPLSFPSFSHPSPRVGRRPGRSPTPEGMRWMGEGNERSGCERATSLTSFPSFVPTVRISLRSSVFFLHSLHSLRAKPDRCAANVMSE